MVINSSEHLGFKKSAELLLCGFTSGLLQAGLFNPWDRALYLSVKHERAFLHIENFRNPMAGVLQTLFQRAISSGLYFPLEEMFLHYLASTKKDNEQKSLLILVAGSLAGALNGIMMNPLASIKYHYWGKTICGTENVLTTARDMFQKGGIRPFYVGSSATVIRDLVFGGCYSIFRYKGKQFESLNGQQSATRHLLVNIAAGCLATIASSPFNYVRNVHYATPPEIRPASAYQILLDLWTCSKEKGSRLGQLKFLQARLRIGWGTARVGHGMAFASLVYSYCSSQRDMEIDIEAVVNIIMSDEKLLAYVNALVKEKLSSLPKKGEQRSVSVSVVDLIDSSIEQAIEEIKLMELVRGIKSQIVYGPNSNRNRKSKPLNVSSFDLNQESKLSNSNGHVDNLKFLSKEKVQEVENTPIELFPTFSTSEPLSVKNTTKRTAKNTNKKNGMLNSDPFLNKSKGDSKVMHSDEATVSNLIGSHLNQNYSQDDSPRMSHSHDKIGLFVSQASLHDSLSNGQSIHSTSPHQTSQITDKKHKLELVTSISSENYPNQSADSLEFKNTITNHVLADSTSSSFTGFPSLISSAEKDREPYPDDFVSDSSPTNFRGRDRTDKDDQDDLRSWEKTVSKNLEIERENSIHEDNNNNNNFKNDNKNDNNNNIDIDNNKGQQGVDEELITSNKSTSESDPKPPKSILCKVSRVKAADESGQFEISDEERVVRVNFITGLVSETQYRDKVTPSERPLLFYTPEEENQFSLDITREHERADEMGLSWIDWIERRTDEDVKMDDELEKYRRLRENDYGGSFEDSEDAFEEDEVQYNDDNTKRKEFNPAERQVLSAKLMVFNDDEIDDYSNEGSGFNRSNENSSPNNNGRSSARYALNESYPEDDFEFDTEDLPNAEDDDF